jgi:hypothetical protein
MTQTQSQSQRPLLRIGSIAFLAGVIIVIVSTTIHLQQKIHLTILLYLQNMPTTIHG